jgi:hypothetical protein
VGTAEFTISGGTPFTNATLHFVYVAVVFSGTVQGAILRGTEAVGSTQPLLVGLATAVTAPGTYNAASLAVCPCIYSSQATTDGTITTGKPIATIVRVLTTPGGGASGTLSGVIDENAAGTITSEGTWPYTAYTIDANGVGTITGSGQKTIHFIIGSDTVYTLDESTQVKSGSMRSQNSTSIENANLPYIIGRNAGALSMMKTTAHMSGVVTLSGATSGTITGTVDVIDDAGSFPAAAASGSYTSINATTGRGTGTANLVAGSSRQHSDLRVSPPDISGSGCAIGKPLRDECTLTMSWDTKWAH